LSWNERSRLFSLLYFLLLVGTGVLFADQTTLTLIRNVPFGTMGQAYSQTLTTTDGAPPFQFAVTGGMVPPGLTLSPTGTLSGTPTAMGSYGFDVSVTDANGRTGSGNIAITIVGPPLTVSPSVIPNGAVGQDYSVAFTASGGAGPYYYAQALTIVPGLTLDGSTGILSGKPLSGGTYTFRIDAQGGGSTGSATYTLTIAGPTAPFFLTPTTLDDATVGKMYFGSVQATTSIQPIQYSIASGTLPPGISLNLAAPGVAMFVGVPTAAGSYSFQLRATANTGTVTTPYSMNVVNQPIRVGPDFIPSGINGVPYSVSFTATGGTLPYTFVAKQGLLTNVFPLGLSLSSGGVLSGSPVPGNQDFTIEATDSQGVKGTWDYTLVVTLSTISLFPTQLPPATLRTPYLAPLSPSGGVAPYTFAVTGGALPSGMSISSGSLAGTPQQAGLFNFRITAYDSVGSAGSRDYQLQIQGQSISLGPGSLPNSVPSQPYSAQLTASGGTPPYTFSSSVANNWAVGWQVAANGMVTGNGPAPGTILDFIVVATDANGSAGTREFLINSQTNESTIALSPVALPEGTSGTSYSASFTASGGTPPYTYSVASGILPDGTTLSSSGLLSGTLLYPISYMFVVRARDVNGITGTRGYVISVTPPPEVCSYTVNLRNQTFSAAGSVANISVRTSQNCTWTVENPLSWVVIGQGISVGSQDITLQVLPNGGAARTGVINVAGTALTVSQQSAAPVAAYETASLAQVTTAGDWATSVTLVNTNSSASNARLSFFNNSGGPMSLPLTFAPASGDSSSQLLTLSLLDRILPGKSMVTMRTEAGSGEALEGWGRLEREHGVSGFGIFRNQASNWESAVPLEERNAQSYFLAFDNTENRATGVAISNLTSQSLLISVIIRDNQGNQIGTSLVSLPANGHQSFMLVDSYPVTAGKTGSVEFRTPSPGQVSVLGLRANGPSLTTLPVIVSPNSNSGSIAHVLYNGGFTNSFTLVNTSSSPALFTLRFFADDGRELQVPLHIVQTSEYFLSTLLSRSLPGNASLIVETVGQEWLDPIQGSARLDGAGTVNGFSVFRWFQSGQEASVPIEARNNSSYVIPFDNAAGVATGIALSNRIASSTTIQVIVRDDTGFPLQSSSLDLPAYGHTAFMVRDLYPITQDKIGTIEFVTPQAGSISAIGLRATPTGNLTTIPVM
jgi:hypothetical protein